MAVAWAAMFVPFLVFLKPSTPHDRIRSGVPLWSVIFMMVLFGDTLMLQMGISLYGMPWNNLVAVVSSGKMLIFLCIVWGDGKFEKRMMMVIELRTCSRWNLCQWCVRQSFPHLWPATKLSSVDDLRPYTKSNWCATNWWQSSGGICLPAPMMLFFG